MTVLSSTEGIIPGWPIRRKIVILDGTFIREGFKTGKFVRWHNKERRELIIEYPDGTLEMLRPESWEG